MVEYLVLQKEPSGPLQAHGIGSHDWREEF